MRVEVLVRYRLHTEDLLHLLSRVVRDTRTETVLDFVRFPYNLKNKPHPTRPGH